MLVQRVPGSGRCSEEFVSKGIEFGKETGLEGRLHKKFGQ